MSTMPGKTSGWKSVVLRHETLLLACVSPALTHLHIEAYWEKTIQGAIILLAVVADGLRQQKTAGGHG